MAPKAKIAIRVKELLQAAFNVFDEDNSGALSLDELRAIFQRPGGGCPLTDEQVELLFHEFDVNGDGVLQFEEFAAFWTTTIGDVGDDLLNEVTKDKKSAPMQKSKSPMPLRGPSNVLAKPKASTKKFQLQSQMELGRRLQTELARQKECKDRAAMTMTTTFERKLGAALIRNDKDKVLKAGKHEKYLANLIRSWDKNGDNVISLAEFRLAVRNPPVALKADNNEIDTLFKSFDADNSGTLSLKEMVPFLKALQKEAYAAEEEANILYELAEDGKDVATALREAAEAMGEIERLKADLEEVDVPLSVMFMNGLNKGGPKEKIRIEDAPIKVFGMDAKVVNHNSAQIGRIQFKKGVLHILGESENKSVESERLVDQINAWYSVCQEAQGLSVEDPKAKIDVRAALHAAHSETLALQRKNEAKLAVIQGKEKRAKELQKAIVVMQFAVDEKMAEAEKAGQAKELANEKKESVKESVKKGGRAASGANETMPVTVQIA